MNWVYIYAGLATGGYVAMTVFWLLAECSVRYWRKDADSWRRPDAMYREAVKLVEQIGNAERDGLQKKWEAAVELGAQYAADADALRARVQELEGEHEQTECNCRDCGNTSCDEAGNFRVKFYGCAEYKGKVGCKCANCGTEFEGREIHPAYGYRIQIGHATTADCVKALQKRIAELEAALTDTRETAEVIMKLLDPGKLAVLETLANRETLKRKQ